MKTHMKLLEVQVLVVKIGNIKPVFYPFCLQRQTEQFDKAGDVDVSELHKQGHKVKEDI